MYQWINITMISHFLQEAICVRDTFWTTQKINRIIWMVSEIFKTRTRIHMHTRMQVLGTKTKSQIGSKLYIHESNSDYSYKHNTTNWYKKKKSNKEGYHLILPPHVFSTQAKSRSMLHHGSMRDEFETK